ncbi:MAG: hypothetical protein WBL70_01130 [Candidatus Acidiferrales bacterium]
MADTAPKPFVFVLMPFDQKFDDIYQLGIKPAAEGAGAYCERIDEQIFAESILARIYNQIAKADIVVADMTGRNPNVFYEVGYAHALGKTAILLTQNSEDIPFDLKHYPHIIYGTSIAGMKNDLGRRVAHHLANPTKRVQPERTQPNFTIAGTLVAAGGSIDVPIGDGHPIADEQTIVIGINNPGDTVIDWRDSSVALILPEEFPTRYLGHGVIQLLDKRFLFDLGGIGRLLPGGWEMKHTDIRRGAAINRTGQNVPAELRIFSPSGPLSTIFALKFVPPTK